MRGHAAYARLPLPVRDQVAQTQTVALRRQHHVASPGSEESVAGKYRQQRRARGPAANRGGQRAGDGQ
ncbi:hypothetical protein GCM10023259_079690 [Thermocatellispora tengchongensis]